MDKINNNLYPTNILNTLKFNLKQKIKKEIRKELPKFVFLCGKAISNSELSDNRSLTTEFYKNVRKDIICIYSEKLWDLFKKEEMELLTFEEFLAEFSDGIILFLESYGTACELGAFSMKEELIEKMLVFNDKKYSNSISFINDGPIKKLINRKKENIISIEPTALFSTSVVYDKLLNFIPNEKECKLNNIHNEINPSSFVLEILELILLLHPINKVDLINIYKYIKSFNSFQFHWNSNNKTLNKIKVSQVIELLKSTELIDITNNETIILKNKNFIFKNYMLNLHNQRYNEIRAEIISRKYRYKKELMNGHN